MKRAKETRMTKVRKSTHWFLRNDNAEICDSIPLPLLRNSECDNSRTYVYRRYANIAVW